MDQRILLPCCCHETERLERRPQRRTICPICHPVGQELTYSVRSYRLDGYSDVSGDIEYV